MGNILLISENNEIIEKYKRFASEMKISFNSCCTETTLFDLIEVDTPDIFIMDERIKIIDSIVTLKKIRARIDTAQIILLTKGAEISNEISKLVSWYIPDEYPDDLIIHSLNSILQTKKNLDKVFNRNKDLADSLYRLNVLYNTSSQFSGTLDVQKLLEYMIEGLDKSLSFDLTSTISFEFAQEPVLIINSLYDVSDELVNALKFRAILNYKSLFEDKQIPFEIDDNNLKVVKKIKNPNEKFTFSIFQYDNMFAPIDLGDEFFGCIEIFKSHQFTTDDAAYFQTIVRQVSLPLKSAGLYKALIEKNNELEKLERIKSDFISIVSHELRTPLTPIKNALSILSSGRCGQLEANAVKFVDMAKRNADNLTNIINDILDINKIEAGKMEFNYKIMNIHSVVENVAMAFDFVAKEHEINLVTRETENLPDIFADSQRLGQVLTNLVSNAIKFTPSGKNIVIKTELKNSDDIAVSRYFENDVKYLSGDYIIVSVSDEGIGIREENLVKVFDKFTQIENSLTRKVGGTGLGLPIAKQLIKAHKGAIWCDSEENKGSSFHFAIPVATQHVLEGKTVQKELL